MARIRTGSARLEFCFDGVAYGHLLFTAFELGQLGQEGLLGAVEHAQGQGDGIVVSRTHHLRAGFLGKAHEGLVIRILGADFDVDALRYHYLLRGGNAGLGGLGVGAHQSAGAQQDPAEVPGHHHCDVGETCVLDDFERGQPRGFLRFAVIGIPHTS